MNVKNLDEAHKCCWRLTTFPHHLAAPRNAACIEPDILIWLLPLASRQEHDGASTGCLEHNMRACGLILLSIELLHWRSKNTQKARTNRQITFLLDPLHMETFQFSIHLVADEGTTCHTPRSSSSDCRRGYQQTTRVCDSEPAVVAVKQQDMSYG
jgi:hypothetical protein